MTFVHLDPAPAPLRALRADIRMRGLLGSLSTAWRLGHVALRCVDHLRWLRVLRGRTTRNVLKLYPRIAYRHSTEYLFDRASWDQRLAMVRTHYAFLNRTHDAPFFDRLLGDDGLTVWRSEAAGARFSITLLGPCRQSRHREGDLTLAFRADGCALWKIAFSVVPASLFPAVSAHRPTGNDLVVYIGQVQGAAGAGESIRQATLGCGANAPQDLLMAALAGVATAWNIDVVLGVHPARQLSNGHQAMALHRDAERPAGGRSLAEMSEHPAPPEVRDRAARRRAELPAALHDASAHGPGAAAALPGSPPPQGFDYGAFWQRYHAELSEEGHYLMTLPFTERPIARIPSNHRKRTQVKRRFKRALRDEVARCIRLNRCD